MDAICSSHHLGIYHEIYFPPIVLFQTCTSLSDRAGYFFAQRSHCGKKEEIDQRKPKNIREEKNLEIIPCDGVPGSNATVNKCGHCYTDTKEAKLFINNCGTCRQSHYREVPRWEIFMEQ